MAFCTQCGNKLDEGIKFCTNCGKKIDNVSSQQIVQQHPIQPDIVIHNTVKKGDDASAGFGRAFGETTGTAFGCFVIVIIVILALIVLFSFI
jgi:uncharacterized membrane protein YvbJ